MALRSSAVGVLAIAAGLTCAPVAGAQSAPTPAPAPQPGPAQAAVSQTAPAPSPVPAPTPQEIRERRVRTEIDSAMPGTVVERRISLSESGGAYFFLPFRSTESTWEQVCVTPCSVDLDKYSTYRVGKVNGVLASRSFTLPQGLDRLSIKIEPGSALANHIAVSASAIGLTALIVGGALVGAQKLFGDEDAARTAGFITAGAGIILLGVGIPVAILTKTKILGPAGRIAITPRGVVF
ncbi:MAG TPA: hypothetical protein VGM06_12030 [Polyangiaceae bacterium]|jgi:hypothetical protein